MADAGTTTSSSFVYTCAEGTSAEHFPDKEAKLLKSMKFPAEFDRKVCT
jgi:hypothetical protein